MNDKWVMTTDAPRGQTIGTPDFGEKRDNATTMATESPVLFLIIYKLLLQSAVTTVNSVW